MASSGEIAQVFAQQNQLFMQQNAFAQQIGLSPQGAGVGGFGAFRGPGPGFNYGFAQGGIGSQFGASYGGGSRFGAGAMSALGAVPTAMLGAAGLGLFGGAAAAMSNPMSGAWTAGSAAHAAGGWGGVLSGAGMRGMAMGALGGLAGGAAVAGIGHLTVGSMAHGAQQQMGIQNALGQYGGFFNPQSRTGMGFTRDDSQLIGNMTRQMAHVPEMMTSVGELTNIMQRLRSTNAMSGIRDASEFSKRFKEAIGTIRTVAETLGTTMEEATSFFQHSSGVGLHGKTAQIKNALNAQFTSGMTGMSMGEVAGLQVAGAGMATQIGAKRGLGTRAVTNTAQSIGQALRSGALSYEELQDLTGMEGPESVGAAAQSITGGMVGLAQTAPGQLMMAGLMKLDERGRATLDKDRLEKFRRGEIGREDLMKRARGLSREEKRSFKARQSDLAMELAGDAGGAAKFIGQLSESVGGGEAFTLLMERYGLSDKQADVMRALGEGGMPSEGEMEGFARLRGREASIRRSTDPSAVLQRMKSKMKHALFGGMEQFGANLFNSISSSYDEFIDDIVGRHVVTLSKEGAAKFQAAMASPNTKQELTSMFADLSGVKDMGTALSGGPSAGGAVVGAGMGAAVGGLAGGIIGGLALAASGPIGWATAAGVAGLGALSGGTVGAGAGALFRDSGVGRGVARFLGQGEYGYSEEGKVAELRSMFGESSGEEARRRAAVEGLGTGNLGTVAEEARDALIREKGAEAFLGMSEFDKLKAISARVEESGRFTANDMYDPASVSRKDRIRAQIQEAGTKTGMPGAEALVMAALGGTGTAYGLDVSRLTSDFGEYVDVANRAKKLKEADEALTGLDLPAATLAIIKDDANPEHRKLLKKSMTDGRLRALLASNNPAQAVEAIRKEYGVELKPGDLDQLRIAAMDVGARAGTAKGAAILGSIEKYELAKKGGDFTAIKSKSGDVSVELSRTAFGPAKAFTDKIASNLGALSVENIGENLESAEKTFQAMVEKASGMTGEERAGFVRSAGILGSAVQRSAGRFEALNKLKVGGKIDEEKLLSSLGMSGDKDAMKVLEGTKGTITAEEISGLKQRIAGGETGTLALGGKGAAGDPVIAVLEKIGQNSDKTATLLALLASERGIKDKLVTDTIASAPKENASTNSAGNATPAVGRSM